MVVITREWSWKGDECLKIKSDSFTGGGGGATHDVPWRNTCGAFVYYAHI